MFGWSILFFIFASLLGCLVWGVVAYPAFRWTMAPAVALYFALYIFATRRWKRIEDERREESICTFARALPARDHDTWVVRVVYEEISRDRKVSLRPSDRLEQDLGFLWEDLDDCLKEIARRAGRSVENTTSNPRSNRVVTVADLIEFLEHQPKK